MYIKRKLHRGKIGSRRHDGRRLFVEPLERRLYLTVPALSSLPGADHTIYLDFDGHTVEGANWNNYYSQATLNAPPFDIDGNPRRFSGTELARIEESWKRIAEDYRPFRINVTTVDPGIEALRKSGADDTRWGIRVIVTSEASMVTDPAERCGCGGLAYIDSFNWSSDTPVWVYTTGGKSIAEAASHEAGHALGLSHDGLTSGTTYYQGHGTGTNGWAPIMGVSYYQNVTQWDKGEYYDSNNGDMGANYGKGPDDLSIITTYNGFDYRVDDHGDSRSTAAPLRISGTIVNDGGIIETTSDIDVFSFTTGTGLVTINIDPFTPGPNLDVAASLYDDAENLVATSNSSSGLNASFSLILNAGQYFLHVDGTGWGNPGADPPSGYSDYASLGQYAITGSIVDPGDLPTVSIDDAQANENSGMISFTLTLSKAAASSTTIAWATADGSAITGQDYVSASGLATFAAGTTSTTVAVSLKDDSTYEGDETLTVHLSNPVGLIINDGWATGTILEDDPAPWPTVSIGDASVSEGKLNTKGNNAGTPQLTNMTFIITLAVVSVRPVTVHYATTSENASATADDDYQSAGGVVIFNPGETSKTIDVIILGDNTQEGDEIFFVILTGVENANITDGTGTGTIIDDDLGGKGGGKGGPQKSDSSEQTPIAIADPIWFFEGPDRAGQVLDSAPVIGSLHHDDGDSADRGYDHSDGLVLSLPAFLGTAPPSLGERQVPSAWNASLEGTNARGQMSTVVDSALCQSEWRSVRAMSRLANSSDTVFLEPMFDALNIREARRTDAVFSNVFEQETEWLEGI